MDTNIDLSGQVAIVTGGGRGIGRAIVQTLTDAGAVVAAVARTETELDETAKTSKFPERILTIQADITDRQAVERMVKRAQDQLGPIDLLVNNAGYQAPPGPLWEIDPDLWWETFNVNVRGSFLCIRTVLPDMIQRRRGRIVNLVSSTATRPMPYILAYAASKTALLRMSDSLSLETKQYGITVFAVHPGAVLTEMGRWVFESDAGQKWVPWYKQIFDEGRSVPPERAGQLVLVLASGRADVLSGRYLQVSDDIDALIQQA